MTKLFNRFLRQGIFPEDLKNTTVSPIYKKPVDVTVDNKKQVWHTLYGDHDEAKYPMYKFNIGDQVRISKIKRTFEKGYLPNFSKEIFTVNKQVPRDPPVYKLKDYDGEELKGTFYEKNSKR